MKCNARRMIVALVCLASVAQCPAQQRTSPRAGIRDAQVPMAALKLSITSQLGGSPDWLAFSEDAVWVANSKFKSVQRVSPGDASVTAQIEFQTEPCSGLTFAFGVLWVPLCGTPRSLARVNPTTNTISAILPFGPADSEGGIAASDDSIWIVADDAGTLLRIDPAGNVVRQRISIPPGSFNPLYADGFVWITGNKSSMLTPVNARTGEVLASIPVGPQPRFLTFGAGAIWTLNQGDGSVTRVDIKTRSVIAQIPAGIPGTGGDICFGAGSVWATVFDIPLTQISPESNKVVRQWVGAGGDAIRFRGDFLWLTDFRNGLLWRLAPPNPDRSGSSQFHDRDGLAASVFRFK